MGARITGAGTGKIVVEGVQELRHIGNSYTERVSKYRAGAAACNSCALKAKRTRGNSGRLLHYLGCEPAGPLAERLDSQVLPYGCMVVVSGALRPHRLRIRRKLQARAHVRHHGLRHLLWHRKVTEMLEALEHKQEPEELLLTPCRCPTQSDLFGVGDQISESTASEPRGPRRGYAVRSIEVILHQSSLVAPLVFSSSEDYGRQAPYLLT